MRDGRSFWYRYEYGGYPGAYPGYYYVPPPRTRFGFSEDEISDILVALGVLTVAFTLVMWKWGRGFPLVLAFPTAFGSVLTGFFLHEMGHRFVARRYGCWAEFRKWDLGLVLALLTAAVGFLFAAPGAVYISGRVTRDANGKISLAGPLTNIFVGVFFYAMASMPFTPPIASFVFGWIAYINAFLAFFNLLPIPPLDGSKVLAWNPGLYAVFMVFSLFLMFAM